MAQAHGGSSGNDLDLVLEILGHEPARAVNYYRVSHADVHSVIRVVQPFNGGGIVLPSNASITEWQGKAGRGAVWLASSRRAGPPLTGMKRETSSRSSHLAPYL